MTATFDVDQYRAERNGKLERENEMLRCERLRLERLLGEALLVATAGTPFTPAELLDAIAAICGADLARPAWVEHREVLQAEATQAKAAA